MILGCKAPATRASSFRSALAFLKGTLDVKGVDALLDNSAISGSCHRSYVTKRVLKQRDALTTAQVAILETVVEHGKTMAEKVFAGHCLMCVYGRLRFGDSGGGCQIAKTSRRSLSLMANTWRLEQRCIRQILWWGEQGGCFHWQRLLWASIEDAGQRHSLELGGVLGSEQEWVDHSCQLPCWEVDGHLGS